MPIASNTQIEYRPVVDDDVEQIFLFLDPFMQQQYLLPRDRDDICKLAQTAFAAFDGPRIVGFAAVEIYSKKLAELQCLAVDQSYRRMGIGKALVRCCCQAAQEAEVLELMAISASDEMFKSCGFDYSLPNQKRALFFQTTTGE